MSQISVRNLNVVIDGHPVLSGVNLDVASGEFCVVTGPSGSGKTTFIRLLLSQLQPSAGEITIDGAPISPFPAPDRGVVFQDYSVFPHKTALQNVLVGPQFKRSRFLGRVFGEERKKLIEEAKQALVDVGLEQAASKYPSQLSGGMRQRLAIAQALISRPKVLLLDEPFGALDPETRAQLHRVVLRLWRESRTTIVMVTHDLAEAHTLATRLVTFGFAKGGGGTITADGSLESASAVVTSFTNKRSSSQTTRQKKRKYR
ncbi:ABC transporter ATP-binding protein [Hyphomicrobium facile]|uniref:Amino acid ABC transporter ATP-binding protein, PAAT family n=1 Tax=Hyphomicrobium facile TaxID=51670 RepID=A0A1I7NW84_9HYPH|nr:ABC transporter ATP-binding protein [Hyphomicrobium facile]SFV38936.1 amino acid ABC transporter ATP-binding protein, PAAT family [Hyphomicrobium facile]